MKTLARLLLLLFLALPAWQGAVAQRSGDLSVSPTRVIIEGTKKTETLTLVNRGEKPASYSISFVQYAMAEDGRLSELPDSIPGMLLASQIVDFTPNQITLAPGESREITLTERPVSSLKRGEYRSHLYFKSIPPEPSSLASADSSNDNLSVQVTAVFGVSVPVIVRVGDLRVRAAIVGPEFVRSPSPSVNFQLRREGEKSLFGDFTVTYTAKGSKKPVEVNSTRGLAVYTPNRIRYISLPLEAPDKTELASGKYTIVYRDRRSKSVLAKRDLIVP